MFDLTLLQLFPLLSMFFVFGLGLFVLNSKKSLVGWLFFLISIVFAIWTFGSFKMFTSSTDEAIVFWDRFIYLGVVFMPAFQYHFSLSVTSVNTKRKIMLVISYILSIAFLFLSRTDYFVSGIFRYKWGVHTEARIFHHFFIAFFFFYIFALLWNFYKQYKGSNIKIEKYRLRFLILSFTTLNLIGGIGYLPAYKILIYSPISLLAPLLFSVITGYAIVKYRLMDIRIAFRRAFIYLGLVLFVYTVLTIWSYTSLAGFEYLQNILYTTGVFVSIVLVTGVYILRNILEKFANKYFFFSLYNYQKTINKLSEELNHYNNLEEITNSIVNTIKNVLKLNRAGVLLISEERNKTIYKIAKLVGFNKKNEISLIEDNFLIKYLEKTKKLLVKDELNLIARDTSSKKKRADLEKLHKHMDYIEASICLPLMSNDKLIGIIVLGVKISNDAYTKEDLELLNTLSNQAGIAIENARLYEEVKSFNKTLKQKVNEQTSDIKRKSIELKEKNKNLKELLNMKSDFLRVVNHQLNTPISIMKNSLFMIKEKTFSIPKGLEFIEAGLKRIDETINDFWSAFALEGETIKMNPERTDIKRMISQLIEEKKNLKITKKRNLSIRLVEPKFKIPILFCDSKQIVQTLSNLLDNAINYTPSGYIEILFEKNGNNLKIFISDTGSGISKEDQKKLFQKFSRGSRAIEYHANGSGLGLYIASKMVEVNNGELKLEKTEIDKGSTFVITLPIYINQETYITKEIKLIKQNKKKKTILLLEDEKEFSDIYSNYFKKKGYKFRILEDTLNAVENVNKINPDIILSDIVIPQKKKDGSISNIIAEKGWNFIKTLKKDKKTKHIPILVFTNLNSEEDRKKAKQLKAEEYILKNQVDPEKLLNIIEKY